MLDDDTVGARIATERKLRGLTQNQLAGRAHLSLSLLRKVEQGSRPASPALMTAVAKTLGLEQSRLTGQPYYSGNQRADALHDLIPAMRRELSLYGLTPDEEPETPLLEKDLKDRVAHCSELLYAVDYAHAGELLPGLLQDLRSASATAPDGERARLMDMMRETYDNAKRLVYDLGYPDLGLLAPDSPVNFWTPIRLRSKRSPERHAAVPSGRTWHRLSVATGGGTTGARTCRPTSSGSHVGRWAHRRGSRLPAVPTSAPLAYPPCTGTGAARIRIWPM